MFNPASTGQRLPKHASTDHEDPLFRFHRWLANLRVLEIDEIKSVPYVPVSHPFVERLIGTIRRAPRSGIFLERGRSGAQAGGVRRLFQRATRSSRARRLHAGAAR